ncbi:MAG TPA: dihydrolipoamide acetyltransferase family protein [Xanthobacteraceae bacterium]|nr:dihydrolipoamide acetyltransferase family protein [Xanthobacteraceae bacterium]
MAYAVTMPALSDTMGAGRLVKWTKNLGDKIRKGDVVAEVETDKAVMEVEAFQDGYLSGPLAAEGTEAPVGETLGYITDQPDQVARSVAKDKTGPAGAAAGDRRTSEATKQAAQVSAVLAASMVASRPAARIARSRPSATSAERLAVLATSFKAPLDAGPPYRIERASALREAVARTMIAGATTPTFRVTAQLTLEPLIEAAHDRHLPLSVLLARSCALTIAAHPLFNAGYTPEGLAKRDRIDIGIAVDDRDGLITPVLRDVNARPLADLVADWTRMCEQARIRRLTPADYSGATFYLSDLGVFPVVYAFDSVIPPGATAILSVATSTARGAFCTLACDHRVVFGADAGRFLATLEGVLKDPGKILAQDAKS